MHSPSFIRFVADLVIDVVERVEFADDLPGDCRLSLRERILLLKP
jgi:hypothetical protein